MPLAGLLAAVLRGGDPDLLGRYDAEHRPNAAALLGFTGQLTAVAELRDPEARRLWDDVLARVRDVPGVAQFLARRLAQLDVPAAQWPEG